MNEYEFKPDQFTSPDGSSWGVYEFRSTDNSYAGTYAIAYCPAKKKASLQVSWRPDGANFNFAVDDIPEALEVQLERLCCKGWPNLPRALYEVAKMVPKLSSF